MKKTTLGILLLLALTISCEGTPRADSDTWKLRLQQQLARCAELCGGDVESVVAFGIPETYRGGSYTCECVR